MEVNSKTYQRLNIDKLRFFIEEIYIYLDIKNHTHKQKIVTPLGFALDKFIINNTEVCCLNIMGEFK